MPRYSAFTPYGHLAFSGEPSHAERIYRGLRNSLGDDLENWTHDFDSEIQSRLYAQAIGLARVRHTIERAGIQYRPDRVLEQLPRLEDEYGLNPGADATIEDRREALGRATVVARGAALGELTTRLFEALGSDFVILLTQDPATASAVPSDPATEGNFEALDGKAGKLSRVTGEISSLASPLSIAFTHVHGALTLEANSVIVIDPGRQGMREVARIDPTTQPVVDSNGDGTITITRANPRGHDSGALFTTARFPFWLSDQRSYLVVLTPAAAVDPEKRRVAHDVMQRNARGVDAWGVVEEVSPGQTGPFKVGQSPLGLTPIGMHSV